MSGWGWQPPTIAFVSLVTAACGDKVEGTYSNAAGLVTLELKSGGKADMTMMGNSEHCTYKVEGKKDGKKVMLTCGRNTADFAIHDDGSITGPGFMGIMKKSK